jgi:MtrB/PioB family decaheme-associated outer membrane protein
MSTFSPLFLLGALGVLSAAAGTALAAPDTSQWTCETCPFEKAGVSGAVEAGLAVVSDKSATFGDFTGLNRKGAYLSLGGDLRYRTDNGFFGDLSASTATGSLFGELGIEGRYSFRLGYREFPRHLSDGAMTPFLGVGGADLSLPAGYPAGTTGTMPLADTLRGVELGTTRQRLDIGLAMPTGPNWTHRVSIRHDVKDGLQRMAGSFFSTAAELAAPVDQVTDQIEISTSYTRDKLHGTLAYQASLFRNTLDSVSWANPFTPVVPGATRGQLALAPDNQFHQIMGSAGYQVTPMIRASGDVAVGRLTQDQAYLAMTLNSALAPSVAPLPQASLQGKVDTFNGNINLTATPMDRLRVNAGYSRDVRDNRTPVASYASVATDMFVVAPTSNTPYTFKQDRYKLSADYRGAGGLKASVGFEENDIQRSYQEVRMTREATLWAKLSMRPVKGLFLAGKITHAERNNDGYGVSPWIAAPENPLLRKFYLADRQRDSVRLRADWAASETVHLGVNADVANDDYTNSPIGLTEAQNASLGIDVSATLTDEIQVHAFAQADRIRSRQLGSQAFSVADWSGRSRDQAQVVGIGAKYVKDKLELGADLTVARSRSDIAVETGATAPDFPTATTSMDSLKLSATYQLQENLSLLGNIWYERYDAKDWRVDGVMPSTVSNLLVLGDQAPRYKLNVVRVALRYRF